MQKVVSSGKWGKGVCWRCWCNTQLKQYRANCTKKTLFVVWRTKNTPNKLFWLFFPRANYDKIACAKKIGLFDMENFTSFGGHLLLVVFNPYLAALSNSLVAEFSH